MRNLVMATVFVVLCTMFVVAQQRVTPVQPTGSLNHVQVDGLPVDANKGAARTTSPVPSGCEATATFIAANQMGVLRCIAADLSLLVSSKSWADGTLASGVSTVVTNTASTQVIPATASNLIYLGSCTFSNNSIVDTEVLLQDGSGGTTIDRVPVPGGASTGKVGGAVKPYPQPLKVPTAGNALFFAPTVTGTSTVVSCSGFKSTTVY